MHRIKAGSETIRYLSINMGLIMETAKVEAMGKRNQIIGKPSRQTCSEVRSPSRVFRKKIKATALNK